VVICRNQTELQAWAPMDGNDAYSVADGILYTRIGGAWVNPSPAPVIMALTPGTGWTPAAAPNAPRAVLNGNVVTLYGSLAWAGGGAYAAICTAPAALRPPTTAARNIGPLRQVTGTAMLLFQTGLTGSTGVIGTATGSTGSAPASGSVYLDGLTWVMD
jgi:hypothetical protein